LQKADPSVALHYWRFDQPAPKLFTEAFVGVPNNTGMLQFSQTNPMQFWATDGQIGIERRPGFNTQTEHASVKTENQTLTLGSSFSSFTTMEQDPHNPAHGSFGGFVSSINNAARDPLFFMLHCNVDRLWAKWQWIYQRHDVTSNDTYPGGGQHRKGHNLSDTMWPWNQEMGSPRPNTAPGGSFASGSIVAAPGGQPTVGDMVDYQGVRSFASCIGLDYDDVPYEHQA
jgi:tyrosinase